MASGRILIRLGTKEQRAADKMTAERKARAVALKKLEPIVETVNNDCENKTRYLAEMVARKRAERGW
jgi:hypothetical protein